MRVLFASNYPHLPHIRGGLQTTTHDLCLALQRAGAEAAVLCGLDEHGRAAGQSLADESLGYPAFRAAVPEQALALVAAAWQADAIVVQSGTALVPMMLASLQTQRPTAVYLHNVETHQLHGTLVPDRSLLYLANSVFTALRWRALSGIDCAVIPPVVDAERYLAASGGDRVLFVNPTPIKGVEQMFALAAACPELPFLVVESWNLEPTWRQLCRRRATQLGNVEWLEPTDDMRGVFGRARMLLMPSVWEESFGRTVVEAQINGLPVLASDRGALPENVGDGGLVLDPHAPVDDWAAALRRLYDDREGWGEAARRKGLGHAAASPLIAGQLLSLLVGHANR
jgi:glycosyltransferase involved in cell wall biosynthesis